MKRVRRRKSADKKIKTVRERELFVLNLDYSVENRMKTKILRNQQRPAWQADLIVQCVVF